MGAQVLVERRPNIGMGPADIAWAFSDLETILGLGLRAVLNVPVLDGEWVSGTINWLRRGPAFDPTRSAWASFWPPPSSRGATTAAVAARVAANATVASQRPPISARPIATCAGAFRIRSARATPTSWTLPKTRGQKHSRSQMMKTGNDRALGFTESLRMRTAVRNQSTGVWRLPPITLLGRQKPRRVAAGALPCGNGEGSPS